MIKKFGVRNFCCFKEGMEINFEFNGNVPEEVKNGLDFTTVLGIKGANGSGKTNIIKSLSFLKYFCTESGNFNVNDKIPLDSFSQNEDITEFFVDFEVSEQCYFYELELTKEKVIKEQLYRKTKRKTSILTRKLDEITDSIKDLSELKTIQLKSNASIISLFLKYKFKSEMTDLEVINQFFNQIISNVSYSGYFQLEDMFDIQSISKDYFENPELFDFVKKMLLTADQGIKDIEIKTRIDEQERTIYYPLFQHSNQDQDFFLTFQNESAGTQTLFKQMSLYWLSLNSGKLLAIDEFDIHIHSLILPIILNLFLNPKSNKHHAQFIFTAHNTEIIDKLGKYRTILVNKDDGESYCYRLDEISGSMIRNDRPITPLYLDGKIGGIPSRIFNENGDN